jgi:hypothetical protein
MAGKSVWPAASDCGMQVDDWMRSVQSRENGAASGMNVISLGRFAIARSDTKLVKRR